MEAWRSRGIRRLRWRVYVKLGVRIIGGCRESKQNIFG